MILASSASWEILESPRSIEIVSWVTESIPQYPAAATTMSRNRTTPNPRASRFAMVDFFNILCSFQIKFHLRRSAELPWPNRAGQTSVHQLHLFGNHVAKQRADVENERHAPAVENG